MEGYGSMEVMYMEYGVMEGKISPHTHRSVLLIPSPFKIVRKSVRLLTFSISVENIHYSTVLQNNQ
jgi:hypothetical protein